MTERSKKILKRATPFEFNSWDDVLNDKTGSTKRIKSESLARHIPPLEIIEQLLEANERLAGALKKYRALTREVSVPTNYGQDTRTTCKFVAEKALIENDKLMKRLSEEDLPSGGEQNE